MFNHTLSLLLPFLARKTEQRSGVSADKVLDKQEDSQSQSQRQKKVTEECSKVDSELRSTKKAVRVPSLSSFSVRLNISESGRAASGGAVGKHFSKKNKAHQKKRKSCKEKFRRNQQMKSKFSAPPKKISATKKCSPRGKNTKASFSTDSPVFLTTEPKSTFFH